MSGLEFRVLGLRFEFKGVVLTVKGQWGHDEVIETTELLTLFSLLLEESGSSLFH